MSPEAPIFFKSLKAPLLLAGLLLLASDALAAVKVERARLGSGPTSMRAARYGWCQFSCAIENGDAVDRKVQLRVVAGEGQQTNVFTDSVNVPAKCKVFFCAPILVESSEKYNLEVFVDGRKLPGSRENEMLLKVTTNRVVQAFILDDAGESLGSFNQLPAFKDKLNINLLGAAGAPESHLQYRDCQTLLVCRPDYSKLNARQARAIFDYVARGGTLVFADPKGALEAAKSPLAPLLPSEPLRIRQLDELPSLAKVAKGFKGFGGRAVEFLETAPGAEGFDALSDGKFSVIRCKRFGLGVCKLSAIAPSEANFQADKDSWEATLEALLAGQRQLPDFSGFSATLDQMTGFKAPGLGTVKAILGSYLLILVALIVIGFLLRKSGWAWAAAALFSAVSTLAILEAAKSAAAKKGKLMTSITTLCPEEGASSSESYCAYFSDKTFSLDATGKTPDSCLSAMLPNLNSFLPPGMAMGAAQQYDDRKIGSGGKKKQANPLQFARPMDLKRDASGRFGAQSMNIAANSSRQFMVCEGFLKGSRFESLPELTLDGEGLSLKPWSAPAGVKFDSAFLLLPNGSRPLDVSGSEISQSSGQSLFQADLIAKGLRESLESASAKPVPCVALIGSGEGPALDVGGEPSKQGRVAVLVPASVSCPSGKAVSIPEELVLLQAGDSSTRMAMDGNRLKQGFEVQGPSSLTFAFTLPCFAPSFDPSEIRVRFAYSNGGNIKASAALQIKAPPPPPPKPAQPGKKAPPPKAPAPVLLKGVEREPGLFVFSGEKLKEALDSKTGVGLLQIEGVEKNPALPESVKMRAGKWSPLSVSISVKGSLPEGAAPYKF